MSEADKAVSTLLPSFAPLSLEEPSETSQSSRITLETLPNELVSAIFLHLDDFILPPLSKRLLPFLQTRLYKKVTLNIRQEELFREALRSNDTLGPLVESLVLNFDSERNFGRDREEKIPNRNRLLSLLPNLKEVSLNVDDVNSVRNYPKITDFDKNPRLEKFLVRSWFYEEEEYNRGHNSSAFDWTALSWYEMPDFGKPALYEDQSDPEVVLELERLPDASFGVRYFAGESTEIHIHSILRDTSISKLEIVALTHQVHLDRLLFTIGHPSLLTHLSLFSLDQTVSHTPRKIDFLSRFPNLTHLALGGTSLPKSLDFYNSLHSLPLESLHLGPCTSVKVHRLIDFFAEMSKPSGSTTLKRLVLDNIQAQQPSEEDREFASSMQWIFPLWTTDCSEEKVKELREFTTKLGIEVDGSTFRGLEIGRSAAYEAARAREVNYSDVEEDEEEDEEDEEEVDGDEDYLRYLVGYENERLEAIHEALCGCWRDWEDCQRFSVIMDQLT
ncbi:hypothetical protein JCM5350_001249 [Sporobolomyces pararoseus]